MPLNNNCMAKYFCQLSTLTDIHVVREPIRLDCTSYACKDCIIRQVDTLSNQFKCNCAFEYHHMDINNLKVDEIIIKDLKYNLKSIYDWIERKSLELISKMNSESCPYLRAFNPLFLYYMNLQVLTREVPNQVERLHTKIDHLEGDIPVRTESIYNELDLIEEEMICKIDEFRLENLRNLNRFMAFLRSKLEKEKMNLSKQESNLNNFYHTQYEYLKVQKTLSVLKETKKLLEIDNQELDITWLGNFTKTKGFESFTSIHTETTQQLEGHFCRMTILNPTLNHFLLTNYADSALNVIDMKGNLLRVLELGTWLTQAFAICVNTTNNEIFVNCYGKGVFVFDGDYNYKRRFGKGLMGFTSFMILDNMSRDKRLYASDYQKNVVTIWNSGQGELMQTFRVDRPDFMMLNRDFIYVTSSTLWDFEWKYGERVLTHIQSGSNCIFEMDKNTYELIRMIKLDYWLEPRGLHFDSNHNILTLAYEVDTKSKIVSSTRSVFVLNKWGNCINKIKLYSFDSLFWDMLVINNKLMVLYQYQIKTIEFQNDYN